MTAAVQSDQVETSYCDDIPFDKEIGEAIETVIGALKGFDFNIPPEALECMLIEVGIDSMNLTYTADADELRKLLGGLKSLKKDYDGRPLPPPATELARRIVDLDPILATFPPLKECWTGTMAQVTANQKQLLSFVDSSIAVPVRSVSRAAAERWIAWLLSQMRGA